MGVHIGRRKFISVLGRAAGHVAPRWFGPDQSDSRIPVIDVTRVAFLREQLGRASTALRIIGIFSILAVLSYLPLSGWAVVVVALLTPGCAFLIAKRLRSGRTWAVRLAAIWFALFTAWMILDAWPNALRLGMAGNRAVGMVMLSTPFYFLARILVAFVVYRVRRRKDAMVSRALALSRYEDGLPLKKRPRFISKKSIAAYGLLVLSPLPLLLLWLSQQQQDVKIYDYDVLDPAARRIAVAGLVGDWMAAALLFFGMAFWGTLIYRRARKAAMLPGSALIKKDKRPIALYLRSFQDDSKIKLRARVANGRILPERLIRIPFEEVVTDHLWRYGPVLAIGNPQARSKTLGAARDYVDDSAWQQKVTELMGAAAMIVAVAGGTEGLAWEIDTITRLGSVSKLVLLLPPVGVRKLRARWQTLTQHAGSNILPASIDFARSRAVFFPKGEAAVIAGDKGGDWTYEAVLDEAALMIATERDADHLPASRPQRVSSVPRMRRVIRAGASDLASIAGGALVTALLAFFWSANNVREGTHPLTSAINQGARERFIAEMTEECRQANPDVSAEQLTKYCTCFANDLADAITLAEYRKMDSDPSAFQAKAESVASVCSEKTLGQ